MTTYFDFVPSTVAPFQFQPELDGTIYTCVVTWSLFGRRYYISCYALADPVNPVFTRALSGSPAGLTLQGFDWDGGTVTAATIDPHGYPPGSTVRLTISGATPDGFNGTFDCLIVDGLRFTYALATDPGPVVAPGAASRDLNLAGGYFSSSLVYRTANRQFEVSP